MKTREKTQQFHKKTNTLFFITQHEMKNQKTQFITAHQQH